MLYAYGGAKLYAKGCATKKGGKWTGEFEVEVHDLYEFVKEDGFLDYVKQGLSSAFSPAYSAAVYLEKNCGKTEFNHEAKFKITCP